MSTKGKPEELRGRIARAEAPPPLLLEGIAQFNRGEYFEQHETLEILWRAEARPVRRPSTGLRTRTRVEVALVERSVLSSQS